MTRRLLLLLVLGVALAGAARAEPSALPVAPISGKQVLELLRAGGLVIYFRHTSTDFGQSDEQMTSFEDCSKQRNLTDRGRDEARAIGAGMRALAIPIGQVLASPMCRTLETARLAFAQASETPAVRGGGQPGDGAYGGLRRLLAQKPPAGGNTVIVGHGIPFREIAGAPHLAEGEAAVIRPKGALGFEIVARVRADEWPALAERP